MNSLLHKVLKDAFDEGNIIAGILLSQWDNYASRKIELKDLKQLVQLGELPNWEEESGEKKIPENLWKDKDLRIMDVQISGFKAIPLREDGMKYGIQLNSPKANDQPHSIVVIGGNGSGKTSIYSAIELLWLNSTAIAKKHKPAPDQLDIFYSNISSAGSDYSILVKTCTGSYKYAHSNKTNYSDSVKLGNFFCSESDLALIECEGDSITHYVNEQIGLGELAEVKTFLNQLHDEGEEPYQKLMAELDEINPESPEYEEKKKESERLEKQLSLPSGLAKKLSEAESSERKIFLPDAQKIIERVMKNFEDEYVSIGYTEDEETHDKLFNGKLKNKSTGEEIEPRFYFNNFRFKLYLVSIRIAMAFHYMNTYKISFPLIFDDVFDSSDFDNRLSMKGFIERVLEAYSELVKIDTPLQIIFFTQDEVIASSVYEGITNFGHSNSDNTPAIFARLYHPEEVRETDKINKKGQQKSKKRVFLKGEYFNLYDKIKP